MKRFLASLLGGAMLAGSTQLAAQDTQDDFDERWYFTPSIGAVVPDDDRNQEYGFWVGAGLGKPITDWFSLELELSADDGPLEDRTPGTFAHLGLGVNARFMPRYDAEWRPYLLGGVGLLNHSYPGSGGTDEMFNLGAGVERTINSHGTRFRVEVRYRLDKDSESISVEDDFEDWLWTMGLTVPLGKKAAPPPPAPEPAPSTLDTDGDGVPDARDRCPDTPAGVEVDRFGCEKDSDGDGVADSKDKCPDTRRGAVVDRDGCEVQVTIDLEGVHFEFDKAVLRPESKATLDAAVKILKEHPQLNVEVAGHTDAVGAEAYNLDLSKRRARAVFDYLVANGIDSDRLTTNGYGESRPIATNDTAEGRALNRRTELVILGVDTGEYHVSKSERWAAKGPGGRPPGLLHF